jgi:glycosyltransferase involved in cell wall biosynthesis
MSDQKLSVSLIIPTYRRESVLVDCIRCALCQEYQPLEILVIDQTENHEPATEAFLKENAEKITLIQHQPPSAVTSRNVGLQKATGDILIFIDDDTTFESDFVSNHVRAIENGADVVQGRVVEEGRGVSHRAQWVLPWLRVVGSNTYDKPAKTNTITGCNFSITKQAADRVGGFDSKITGVVAREDADYGARCDKLGLIMRFDPTACLVHHRDPGGGVDAAIKASKRIYDHTLLRNELYFARKHFPFWVVAIYKWRLKRRMRKMDARTGVRPPAPPSQLIRDADRAAKRRMDAR